MVGTVNFGNKLNKNDNNMKNVKIYFKSGNILKIKCKVFEMTIVNGERKLNIDPAEEMSWLIDLKEIEAFTCKKSFF